MNIIFLDIDGVLNNRQSDSLLFECIPSKYRIDENNFNNLMKILQTCDCKIMLSTSWRNYPDDHTFENNKGWVYTSLLPELREKLGDYILCDATHCAGRNKYGDILETIEFMDSVKLHRYSFIDISKVDYDKIAIIDDDPMQNLDLFNDEIRYPNIHWFKTSKNTGLDDKVKQDIINYFN